MKTSAKNIHLLTLPQFARQENISDRQAEYAARGVAETYRVGIVRLYDAGALEEIRAVLRKIAGKRQHAVAV